jgi:hypothetical protein
MRGETKMMFRGVIEGLRSGIYTSVDVLFVTWENDDMNCSAEVRFPRTKLRAEREADYFSDRTFEGRP